MAKLYLSEAEKTFVLHGVENDLRCDGRSRMQYRPIELETDVVPHASGSACLRLANTHVLVGVKTEIDVPFPERPDEGKLEFFIDCSANATPAFEGRGGEELAVEISNSLARAYQSPQSFNLKALNIMPGQQCWKLYVDILLQGNSVRLLGDRCDMWFQILECGGNLFDAISLAVKAALHNTQIPQVKAVSVDGGQLELNLSDDPFDCWRLDLSQAPVLMTLCKVGEHCILDPTGEEETCCAASAVVAVTPQARVTSVFKTGVGSFNPQTLAESLKVIPLVHVLDNELQKDAPVGSGLQGVKNDLLASLKIRYMEMEDDKLLASATLLDPRFKTNPFRNVQKMEIAKTLLLLEAKQLLKTDLGHEVGLKLNEALQLALQKEEALGPKREKFGFLK